MNAGYLCRAVPPETRGPFRPHKGRWQVRVPALVFLTGLALVLAIVGESLFPAGAGRRGGSSIVSTELARKAAGAETVMRAAGECIRAAKAAEKTEPDPGVSATDSALIGAELTSLVTTLGNLEAKRISVSPEWARELTIRLHQEGVRPGDAVAAGFSGSFPGLNLAITAACNALDANLVAVSSVTASMWGANQPGFTWPEMEARLVEAALIRRASAALSLGGAGDRALDLEPEARALGEEILHSAAGKLGVAIFSPATFSSAVSERMALYEQHAKGRRIALYINVGGGEVSLGRSAAILRLRSGFLPGRPFDLSPDRGVIARFAERGVKILTLLNVRDLALRWGIHEARHGG